MPQPLDLQAGGVKPPDPVAMPSGRILPADMSFFTLVEQQVGHWGCCVSEGNMIFSNLH